MKKSNPSWSLNSVAVIGLGLIGGSFAKAVKKNLPDLTIGAFDFPEIQKIALTDGVIDKRIESIEEAVNYDLIYLALPTDLSLKMLQVLAPLLNESHLITDVSGVKIEFHNLWNGIGSKGSYVGGHPMTGKERGGYVNSDPLLFENAVYIATSDNNSIAEFPDFANLLSAIGATTIEMTASEHDRVVARVSHLPQLLAVALTLNAEDTIGELRPLDFAAGGFRDMTRIASSDYTIWKSVLELNRDAVLTELSRIKELIVNLEQYVTKSDHKFLYNNFETARKLRDEIPKSNKGFMSSLYEIYVYVVDKPGVIAEISGELFNAGLSIKDMELLKIREGTGGTFRLSFDSYNTAVDAAEHLRSIGYEVTGV